MTYSPPGRNKMKHVERVDLYVNLRKRIEYLHAFLNFTSDDIDNLHKGAKFLRGAIPILAHRLYEKLLQFDLTARALKLRSTNSNSDDDDLFTIDSPQVQRRKIFWKWYLTRLFSDPSRMEYWEYLDKIGRMHRGRILIHPLHIEYIHMNVCLGHVQDLIFEFISTNEDYPVEFRFALIRTVNKLLNVQNDLITRWYVKDGEEFYHDDEDRNDITFMENATECPFDASELSEDKTSNNSSIHTSSISSKSEKERKHLSYLQGLNGANLSTQVHQLPKQRSLHNFKEDEPSKPASISSKPRPSSGACPFSAPSASDSSDSPPPSRSSSSREPNNALRCPAPIGIPSSSGVPYSGLPGATAGNFETKIWSANDSKHKKTLFQRS
ncbi:hypothetical protein KEM56_006143 [Ascosphaera pollenicola]|nr:hypothetical protein KEM56_006143 [Ascosphaera pollenicola]